MAQPDLLDEMTTIFLDATDNLPDDAMVGVAAVLAALRDRSRQRTCTICGDTIHFVREPHWQGWDDDNGCELAYSPYLHDHTPEVRA